MALGEPALNSVRDGSSDDGNGDEVALCILNALADCFGDLGCLAHSYANTAFFVTNDDERGEAEDLTALNNLGNTVDGNELFLKFRDFRSRITPVILHLYTSLEIQSGLTGAGCQLLYTTGVKITAAVINDLGNALIESALCNGFADDESCFLLVLALELSLNISLNGGSCCDGAADAVIDDLGIDVVQAAVNAQTGPFGRADDMPAHTMMTSLALCILIKL